MARRHLEGGWLMLTALSSAAAPRATLDELLAGLTRHGLSALELHVGHAHGVDGASTPAAIDAAVRRLREAGVRVVALHDDLHNDHAAPSDALGDTVRALDTRWTIGRSRPLAARIERANWARNAGVPVAVLVGGPSAVADAGDVRRAGHAVVWDAHPDDAPLAPQCERVLAACGGSLVAVRLCGGGPEGSLHEGRGLGGVMARLTLAGFDGALVLAPSDRKYHVLWDTWLGRHSGWGCGSRAADPAGQHQRPLPVMEEIA